MKHKLTITLCILGLFLITQFVGLFVVSQNSVPAFLSESENAVDMGYGYYFFQIVTAMIISVGIFVFITKYKLALFMRIWFLIVLTIAMSVSLSAIINLFGLNSYVLALCIAIPLAILKLVRPSIITHNGTEVLIYPGLAAIFVQILSPLYIILLLILITIYDVWAVWHSGIMQKMAKFQMNEMKVFGGFFIPYLTKEMKAKIKLAKQKFKNKSSKKFRGVKVPIALLGGGDVVFPIITAGVFMNAFGIVPALFIIFGAFAGLTYLLLFSEKKKFYPAMVYITPGIFLGILIWWLISFI